MVTITLAPWAPEHLGVLIAANTPTMTRYLGGPESENEVRVRHDRYLGLGTGTDAQMFAVEADGTAVGAIGFWTIDHDGEPAYETGWHVLADGQGRGVARVALRALIDRLVEMGPSHRLLLAFPSVDNVASNSLCRGAGFDDLGETEMSYRGTALLTRIWALDLHRPPG